MMMLSHNFFSQKGLYACFGFFLNDNIYYVRVRGRITLIW